MLESRARWVWGMLGCPQCCNHPLTRVKSQEYGFTSQASFQPLFSQHCWSQLLWLRRPLSETRFQVTDISVFPHRQPCCGPIRPRLPVLQPNLP